LSGPAAIPDERTGGGRLSSRGFTLLEVIAALAILMLFLVPIMGSITQGLRNVSRIKGRSVALRLAQNRMEELQMMKVPEDQGTEEGDFGYDYQGYRWEMEAVKTPELEMMEEHLSIKGVEIHLRVYWEEAGSENVIEFQTLLLE